MAGDRAAAGRPPSVLATTLRSHSARWDETHRAQPTTNLALFRCPSGVPTPHQSMSLVTARDALLLREPDKLRPDRRRLTDRRSEV